METCAVFIGNAENELVSQYLYLNFVNTKYPWYIMEHFWTIYSSKEKFIPPKTNDCNLSLSCGAVSISAAEVIFGQREFVLFSIYLMIKIILKY